MVDNSQDIERSRQAQEILDHDIFKDALVMLREHYKELWATTKTEEKEQRESIWMAMKLIPEFERQLRIVVEKGVIKRNQIIKIKQNIA